MLGLYKKFHPRFVRRYGDVAETMIGAFRTYLEDVKGRNFPTTDESY
jgi:3-methyl-2-oxobutanoate hydroxymethyltransferase